jgi:hypothetical protein
MRGWAAAFADQNLAAVRAADPKTTVCRAGVEGETIRAFRMVDPTNFHERLKARQAEDRIYLERLDLTAKMIPVMVETVETFTQMGASRQHIVRFLQATIEELLVTG